MGWMSRQKRLLKAEVNYRFVIDRASLKDEAAA